MFEEVLGALEAKKAKREGQAWTTLCEVVMHIAKRVSAPYPCLPSPN